MLKEHLHLSAIKQKQQQYSKHANVNNLRENLHICMQIKFR